MWRLRLRLPLVGEENRIGHCTMLCNDGPTFANHGIVCHRHCDDRRHCRSCSNSKSEGGESSSPLSEIEITPSMSASSSMTKEEGQTTLSLPPPSLLLFHKEDELEKISVLWRLYYADSLVGDWGTCWNVVDKFKSDMNLDNGNGRSNRDF